MDNIIKHFSWNDIEKDCRKIAKKIGAVKIDLIVAITKGGLPPAVILANKYLDKPHIITLQLEEIFLEKKANYSAKKVNIISRLNSYPISGKRVLIVDDVADTGSTLIKAGQLVKNNQPEKIITAVLHYKPRSRITPDIFARKIANDIWIVYPWE